jgi:hypothetical protein
MTTFVTRCTTAFVASAMLVAVQASAQTEPWNQEKVTALAKQLEASLSGLRDDLRKSPAWENQQQKGTLYRISDKLRLIESESISLHAHLEKGAGMAETHPTYERIQRLRRDAQVLAKKTDVSAVTQPKLDRAIEVLDLLAPFYPAPPTRGKKS